MKYSDLIDLPKPGTYNIGLVSAKNSDMLKYFGHPVLDGKYDPKGKCMSPNDPEFQKRVASRKVGPFRATGLLPALDSLKSIFERVEREVPDLYPLLRNNGMLCSRYTRIKGKIGPGISNHSWGTALDMFIEGDTEKQGDNKVQRGLLILANYFNAAGWYWGAAFPTEDGMHFEVSRGLLTQWKKDGLI